MYRVLRESGRDGETGDNDLGIERWFGGTSYKDLGTEKLFGELGDKDFRIKMWLECQVPRTKRWKGENVKLSKYFGYIGKLLYLKLFLKK